jgi:hypothetical protein
MIEMLSGSSGNVIGFKYSGKITDADYKAITPAFVKALDKEGSVNVLMDTSEMQSVTPKAMLDDLTLLREYGQKVGKVAMVGDSQWEEMAAEFEGLLAKFLKGEVKYFKVGQTDAAWAWLRE